MSSTIVDLISANRRGSFLSGTDSDEAVDFSDLPRVAAEVGARLASHTRSTRPTVAILLPHGPVLASALLGVMCHGAAAPLNPQLSSGELEFILRDLGADMLLTLPGYHKAGEQAAQRLQIPRVDCTEHIGSLGAELAAQPNDVALMLHTSGTTARPKLVPLSHANLVASANNVAATMHLSELDRGLAVMPLFHIHGIVGMMLSSLSAGAEVHITGFNALTMQRTVVQSNVTWISAVPTMYQAMLMRPKVAGTTRLRAARSSSSALHVEVWRMLQDRLECPIVNSYGMTEATHQMASTGIDDGHDGLGTVGRAAGAEIAVLAPDGEIRGRGNGEFVVRGAGLTAGYLTPPGANDEAFVNGWFRTGDTGSIDSGDRVRLEGRLKEIINVGGEKVSPFEVEGVLLSHAAIAEAAAFAMPSRLLGEEVQAVVTLCDDADERELRDYVRSRLAKFKTPARIHIVGAIPKGPTGKVQRINLATQLGVTAEQ